MLKRKLVEYGDSADLHAPKRHNNGYSNSSSRIETDKTNKKNSSNKHSSKSKSRPNDSTATDSSTTSESLSNLLSVLGNILGNHSKKDLVQELGEEGYSQFRELKSTLTQKFSRSNAAAESSNTSAITQKQPEIPPPTSVTPWTAASIPKSTPPLPHILDPVRERQAFTHSAINRRCCYERLEWVGDIYLELTATLLISSTFPDLPPGKCSQLREKLVKNETLANLSREYGFDKRAILPQEFTLSGTRNDSKASIKGAEKVLGDIFEAYCAAIVYSDPEEGIGRLANWLKALWARILSSEILALKTSETKTEEDPNTSKTRPPKELLTCKLMSKGIRLNYKDAAPEKEDPSTGQLVYTIGVYLDGWGENGKLLGVGEGISKKIAGQKAAEIALANKKVLSVYEEMKKEWDAKRRVEEEQADADKSSAPNLSAS